jgi:hypothetical protein
VYLAIRLRGRHVCLPTRTNRKILMVRQNDALLDTNTHTVVLIFDSPSLFDTASFLRIRRRTTHTRRVRHPQSSRVLHSTFFGLSHPHFNPPGPAVDPNSTLVARQRA